MARSKTPEEENDCYGDPTYHSPEEVAEMNKLNPTRRKALDDAEALAERIKRDREENH